MVWACAGPAAHKLKLSFPLQHAAYSNTTCFQQPIANVHPSHALSLMQHHAQPVDSEQTGGHAAALLVMTQAYSPLLGTEYV